MHEKHIDQLSLSRSEVITKLNMAEKHENKVKRNIKSLVLKRLCAMLTKVMSASE